MWYLQFHFVCDKLFTSFIMMTSLCFFVQLADRTLILSKGSFSVYIIATRLLLNHSPSEWFSYTKKAAVYAAATACRKTGLTPLFRDFHGALAPTARAGSHAGKPLLRKAFCGFAVHPQGAFSCPFGTIHLAPPNPIIASGGQSRAPPVAGGARRKPSEQGSARKAPRADAARPLRTALRPRTPKGFSAA